MVNTYFKLLPQNEQETATGFSVAEKLLILIQDMNHKSKIFIIQFDKLELLVTDTFDKTKQKPMPKP